MIVDFAGEMERHFPRLDWRGAALERFQEYCGVSSFREDGFFLMKDPVSGAAPLYTIPENALDSASVEKFIGVDAGGVLADLAGIEPMGAVKVAE